MKARPIPALTTNDLDRFWARVNRSGDCWLWQAPATAGRYGFAFISGDRFLPNRVSWTIHFGPIPDGQCVCHRCDNPRCVNPSHLFLGTQAENMADMVRKGRHRTNPDRQLYRTAAKLSADEIAAILRDGRLQREIAAQYGVHQSTISDIKRGETWN
jgi:hypothetical protein